MPIKKLTVTEVAEQTGLARSTITRWITRHGLKAEYIDGKYYISRTDLRTFQRPPTAGYGVKLKGKIIEVLDKLFAIIDSKEIDWTREEENIITEAQSVLEEYKNKQR
tara:strand:- start:1572 stop:1895 length:324 start_codon:yes stop_codon:yes gene_type:complete